jgi:hypothetical protein
MLRVSPELDDISGERRDTVADVVYLDADESFTLTLFQADVPKAAVEWLKAEARRRLPRPDTPRS